MSPKYNDPYGIEPQRSLFLERRDVRRTTGVRMGFMRGSVVTYGFGAVNPWGQAAVGGRAVNRGNCGSAGGVHETTPQLRLGKRITNAWR